MSPVRDLIEKVEQIIEKKPDLAKVLTHPKLLISALEELDALVEMEKVKLQVVKQVKFLFINAVRKVRNTSGKFNNHMLHTVIYGPPGVGKTQLGCILAKIWIAIGLAKPAKASATTSTAPTTIERIREAIYVNRIRELHTILAQQQLKIKKIREVAQRQKEIIADLRQHVLAQEIPENSSSWSSIFRESRELRLLNESILNELNSDVIGSDDLITLINNNTEKTEKTEKANDKTNDKASEMENYITIVGRSDLIGEYQGHTATKVSNLLKSNLGKVVFIDEAYSLLNGDRDNFGQEALATINQFMSEHPNEIIIIFAGYKELLSKVFEAQPGLRRRCSAVYDIAGYSAKALGTIFKSQVGKNGWELQEGIELEAFFAKHKESFPSFGGDTQKLSYFSEMTYSDLMFDKVYTDLLADRETELDSIITSEMLTTALKDFSNNDSQSNQNDAYRSMFT
jgi:DNA polymerase III delta prime subunit